MSLIQAASANHYSGIQTEENFKKLSKFYCSGKSSAKKKTTILLHMAGRKVVDEQIYPKLEGQKKKKKICHLYPQMARRSDDMGTAEKLFCKNKNNLHKEIRKQ